MLLSFERRWAKAVLEAFAPVGGPGLAPREGEADYVSAIARISSASTKRAVLGIHLALWLAYFSPIWFCGRLRTMGSLPLPERTEILRRLLADERFLVRETTQLMKIGASLALLGNPDIRARSGYDRHPPAQRSLPQAFETSRKEAV